MIKPPNFVGLATIGIPTLAIILLLLLPFYDRGPERHPLRRPVATLTALFVIFAMGYLTYLGANAGPPSVLVIKPSATVIAQGKAALQQFYFGRAIVAQSGCEACHKIGGDGNDGPGPELTTIGARVPPEGIARTLVNPTEPMPSYGGPGGLPAKQFSAVVAFLSDLK